MQGIQMPILNFVVQASSRNWSGSEDLCVKTFDNKTVLEHTLSAIKRQVPNSRIIVACPSWDNKHTLCKDLDLMQACEIFSGEDESPLKRLAALSKQYLDNASCFVRVDALNAWADYSEAIDLIKKLESEGLDCIKYRDDFPIQFTFDIYSTSKIIELAKNNFIGLNYHVHPKFFMFQSSDYRTEYFDAPRPNDTLLETAREKCKEVYVESRDKMNFGSVKHGDTLELHYQLAKSFINSTSKILDIACGSAKGPEILAEVANNVIGADINNILIEELREENTNSKVSFQQANVEDCPFDAAQFDIVTSFETIEHVDHTKYLNEICRILKPHGKLIMSSPQNSCGHIPMNPQHLVEYSYEELISLVSEKFKLEQAIGIKQGCIIVKNDLIGTNTFLVLSKK